jgi:hypothetical protein
MSLVLSLSLVSQSAIAVIPSEFFCRRLLETENADVAAELFTVKRLGRPPVEVLKVHEPGKGTVSLNRLIDPSTEILFGWEMTGRRPILLLYFQHLEVRITLYPHATSTDPTTTVFTIKDSAYVEKGVYFAARFDPRRIGQAADFVGVARAVEQNWKDHNHIYTNAQRMADLDKLLSFFFLEPSEGARNVKLNQGVVTHPIVVGHLSTPMLKERLMAVKRWSSVVDDERAGTKRAALVFVVVGAVGMSVLVTYALIKGFILH